MSASTDSDITRWPAERRARAGIRRTFQNLKLFREMSVLENVMVGMHGQTRCELWHALLHTPAQKSEEQSIVDCAREALDFVGLLRRRGRSGGDAAARRAAAHRDRPRVRGEARAAAARRAGRRSQSRRKPRLVELIRAIRARGVTIMLVEHHMDVVMPTCDRITVLNYGRRLADGTPDENPPHPEVIKAYLGGGINQGWGRASERWRRRMLRLGKVSAAYGAVTALRGPI